MSMEQEHAAGTPTLQAEAGGEAGAGGDTDTGTGAGGGAGDGAGSGASEPGTAEGTQSDADARGTGSDADDTGGSQGDGGGQGNADSSGRAESAGSAGSGEHKDADDDGGEDGGDASLGTIDNPLPKLRRPLSAYFLFTNAKRPSVKEAHPEATVAQQARIMGKMWGDLSATEKLVCAPCCVHCGGRCTLPSVALRVWMCAPRHHSRMKSSTRSSWRRTRLSWHAYVLMVVGLVWPGRLQSVLRGSGPHREPCVLCLCVCVSVCVCVLISARSWG